MKLTVSRGTSHEVFRVYLPTQNRTIHKCQLTVLVQNAAKPSNFHIKC